MWHRIKCALVVACLTALATEAAVAQPSTPEELRSLFEQDASAGYEAALTLFKDAKARGDVDAMMGVLRVPMSLIAQPDPETGLEIEMVWYGRPIDDMLIDVAATAHESGRWDILGEARSAQAVIAFMRATPENAYGLSTRTFRLLAAAEEAFAKAGLNSGDYVTGLRQALKSGGFQENEFAPSFARGAWTGDPGPLRSVVSAMLEATAEVQDQEALALHRDLVAGISTVEDDEAYYSSMHYALIQLQLPGTEAMIPRLRELLDERGEVRFDKYPVLATILGDRCWMLWFGRDDIYRDTGYWVQKFYVPGQFWVTWVPGLYASKVARFGRELEALSILNEHLALIEDADIDARYVIRSGLDSLWPGVPRDLRATTVRLMCNEYQHSQRLRHFTRTCGVWRDRMSESPRAWSTDPTWAIETGYDLVTLAGQMEKPEDSIVVLEEAAKFFEVTDRPDLADEALAVAGAIAADNPDALQRLALSRAESAANSGQWERVLQILSASFAAQPSTVEFVQARILSVHAYLNLGQTSQANEAFQKTFDLIGTVTLPPGERANYYVMLSRMTNDAEWQSKLLKQAKSTLEGAGLDLLANSVDQELAALALESDDLDAAEETLIDTINRIERRRGQLAFDPLLRQRWFADNIISYRQLMRVAGLQEDGELALACGERMRSRALLDQLAWRKIDMELELAPELRERLADLRTMRRETYALLNQVMGEQRPEESATGNRGMYMPIRGLYMPVRGPMSSGAAATDEDVARLAWMLDDLAAEEGALESAIREQVPAYARAANVSIPSGAELAAEVAKQPGLAVLHYTFADEGLVVTGACGNDLRVQLIETDREALYEQVGHFREAIWERSDDAYTQARNLYQTLIRPVDGVLSGADRLWIVADGIVQLVPFAALIDGSNAYLGQRMPIAFAPSLTLALSSRGEREAPSRSAVVVAAPETGARQLAMADSGGDGRGLYMPIRGMYMPVRGAYMPIRGEDEVSSALTAMAMVPLPEAKAEGEAVAALYDDAVLLEGTQATKTALGEAGADCDVLHIATHGYADPDFPDFSGLLLAAPEGSETPYQVLTAGEVYGWPLKARLVTLSACQTALGRDVEGEGILGLSRAFIYAGAQHVVCSLWPVSDESTRTLMTAFYEALNSGASVEEALQAGQNALPSDGDLAHPFYWAGFIAVRGPA